MSKEISSEGLDDKAFILAFADDYLGDQLSGTDRQRFDKLVADKSHAEVLDRYKEQHGELQVFLQGIRLNPGQMEDLWNIVQEPEARQTRELQKIDEVGRSEFFSDLRKRSLLIAVLAAAVFAVVYTFSSGQGEKFEYLEYVRYEALAIDQLTEPFDDWDLADGNVLNILEFFKLDRGMKFTPSVLRTNGTTWQSVGGSILDYDTKKLAMIQYSSGIDRFFYFSTAGTLSELPTSAPGTVGDITYQAYSSEYYNIVAFEPRPGTISFIVGRLGATEMAKLAAENLSF